MGVVRSVVLEAGHCKLVVRRPAPDVVLITITGSDVGELGDAPFRELEQDLASGTPIRLFIDARATQGASVDVSSEWAAWLRRHREQLAEFHMLVGSRLIHVTADFVKRFAELGSKMTIHTVDEAFEHALESASV